VGQLITSVAGYFTPSDGFQHAIAATSEGQLHEVYFNPQTGIFRDILGCFDEVVAIAGYFTPNDGFQHVIVATSDGDVHEVYFDPQKGVFEDLLAHFDGIIDIAGFFTPDDGYQHVIVATSDGNLHEVYFNPQIGIFQDILTQFSGMVSVAGFFTPDDNYRHAIVATSDGNLHEVYFNPQKGIFQDVLTSFNGIGQIAAYYTPTDGNRHVIVATSDGNLHEVYFNPQIGIFQDVLTTFVPLLPAFEDIGPDTANGTVGNFDATSGLTIGLSGDVSALYAVSLNAGVWKSLADSAWAQLAQSPQYAYCIAVDPNNASHLAVGERDGDAINLQQNHSGVWESYDAGNSWTYSFDPLSLTGCTSQAIPAVAFSSQSTLFAASVCGIGRKPANASTFDFSITPAGVSWVTALSISESKVWARTPDSLLVSSDDGVTWTTKPVPTSLSVGGTTYNITFSSRGGLFSLAAVDVAAYMFFKPSPDVAGNHNTLLVYNVATDSWTVQVLSSGDGTGLGGRRFIKTFILNRPDLPLVVGQRLQIFLGVGQDMSQATGLNSDGTLQLVDFAHTFGSGAPTHDPIHSDIWDFHIASDGSTGWVACDGGVYQKSLPSGGWVTYDQGLHTHHIHTVTVLPMNDVNRSRLAYATSDNDAWYRDTSFIVAPPASWHVTGDLGDANWTSGDAGSPQIALMARHAQLAQLTTFGAPPPQGAQFTDLQAITLSNDKQVQGQLFIQFIQTLKGEGQNPLLDAVMLAHLPLTDANGNPVPGPLGQPNPSGSPVLIRSTQFAANPDANISKFQNWNIEANDLPMGTQGFWVSGGHTNPVYYLYSREAGGVVLYKRNSSGSGWQLLLSNLQDGGSFGPAFVNPYNPNMLYVLAANGVKVSFDGGANFQDEVTLTALLTGSGTFPFTGNFSGGNGQFVSIGSRANAMGTLSDMAFYRDNPNRVVAASPFTGVFYTSGDGCWRDLSPYLPRPHTPVSSVGIDCEAIYAGMEGRSLVRIVGYREKRMHDLLHLTGVSNVDARLKYTFRPLLGCPWQPFIDVNAQASNNPGILNAVACAADGDDLHVIATTTFAVDPTNGGKLWHTIRFADGSWQGFFDNVKAQQHIDPGLFTDDISCAAAFGLLHVFGCTTGDGDLWHTTRTAATGAWQDFENVDTKVPSGSVPGAFFGVGCAVIDNGDLHVVTITSADPGNNPANLYHNILPNTPRMWQDFTPVQSQHSVPSRFVGVSCSAAGGDLHFAGVTSDGTLWHSVLPGGAKLWHDFENVSALVANTPGPFTDDVGCAVADSGDLYVVATTGDGELWLTSLPAATGSGWDPFVDVKTLVSNYPGPFLAVSIASPVKFI
jgi:hypothetical protein